MNLPWYVALGLIVAVVIGGRLLINRAVANSEVCPKCKLFLRAIDPDTGYMLKRCRRCLEASA